MSQPEQQGFHAFRLVQVNDNVTDMARQIIEMGILTEKSYDDCQHIGAAIVSGCDCVISWNCKHVVNIKKEKKEVNYFMNRRELATARTASVKQTGLAVGFPEIPLQNWIAASYKAQGLLLYFAGKRDVH